MRLNNNDLVKTSYSTDDVIILLKDLSKDMIPMASEERERLIQGGVHYSMMLPLEELPTKDFKLAYAKALRANNVKVANAVETVGDLLYAEHGDKLVLISLARAGVPIGILVKRYIKYKYDVVVPHYGISIIRDRGIDINAMEYIYSQHSDLGVEHFQFLDGWTGKGAIAGVLKEACNTLIEMDSKWGNISSDLAVLADPAITTKLCGTHDDFLIPSSCLNSIVSGLVSRTILNGNIDEENGDFHGGVYFEEFEEHDLSLQFIDNIVSLFGISNYLNLHVECPWCTGLEVVKRLQKEYGIKDINLIKPGIGETTRVLLRRVPERVLISSSLLDLREVKPILVLCEEKGIPVERVNTGNYKVCGIIKSLHADV